MRPDQGQESQAWEETKPERITQQYSGQIVAAAVAELWEAERRGPLAFWLFFFFFGVVVSFFALARLFLGFPALPRETAAVVLGVMHLIICIARALLAFRPDGHLRVFLSLEVSFLPYLES